MTPVVQEDETGCGIAAVATIVGKSYTDVKMIANAIDISVEDELLFSDTNYVRRLLLQYGIHVSDDEIPFVSWTALPSTALLAIKYHEEQGRVFWHWVVYHWCEGKARVLDSAAYLECHERIDFQDMSPQWYIEVYR